MGEAGCIEYHKGVFYYIRLLASYAILLRGISCTVDRLKGA